MKRNTIFLVGVALLVAAAIVVASRWPRSEAVSHPSQGESAAADQIQSTPVQRKDFEQTLPWLGQVQSRREVRIIAQASGRVVSVEAADQEPVRDGDTLLILGGPMAQRNLARLQADFDSLRRELEAARQIEVSRREALEEKLGKREDWLAAQLQVHRLEASRDRAETALRLYEQALDVLAPISGIFTHRQVNVGQMVAKGDPLAEVTSPDDLRVVARVYAPPGTSLGGLSATVRRRDDEPVITGRITRVLPQRDETGARIVWIKSDTVNRQLNPGETVTGDMTLIVRRGVLAVPVSAVVRDAREQAWVFIKEPQGYRRQHVITGLVSDGWIEITEGLSPDAEVVMQGAYELFYQDFNQQYKVAD